MMLGMSDAREELHEQVRDERRRRKLTQLEVAREAGIGLRTYQTFEKGQTTPQPENLKRILRVLGLEASGKVIGPEAGRATREAWPPEVQVFLDTMGAFMMTMDEDERLDYIHAGTRAIFQSRRP